MNFEKVETLLNSGNIVFEAQANDTEVLEKMISDRLEKVFGFSIPTMVRKSAMIDRLIDRDPFKGVMLTKDIRLYVSFLRKEVNTGLELPWTSSDSSFKILDNSEKTIMSVLDLSISKTPKAMGVLEKSYGSDITTRNWNTIKRIEKKLGADRH